MKKRTVAAVVGAMLGAAVVAAPAHAQDVKIGLMAAISGPIAALAPPMAAASKLAVAHVNEQGGILKGGKLEAVLGDSACNPQNATDAATKAVNIDRVLAIVGPACSGAVLATANSVAIPAGVLMITPSGTSPEITKLADKDLVFRTLPSDDYQGRALARTLKRWGVCRLVDSEDDDPQPFHLRVRPAIVEIVGEQWLQRLDQHNLGDVEGDDGEGEDDAAA